MCKMSISILFLLLFAHCHPLSARPSFRIVRGSPFSTKYAPYFVLILKGDGVYCGGTILNTKKVLTAAHCVAKNLEVLAGYNSQLKGVQRVSVKKYITHPNYRHILGTMNTPTILDYDVAILTLAHHLLYTKTVRPIHLAPQTNQVPPVGTNMIAMGGGMLREKSGPDRQNILYNVTLPVYDFAQCQRNYRVLNIKLTSVTFCAGYEQGRFDVCNGDSGGPIMHGDLQYGIVSFGEGCGRPGFPSVYTTVPKVLNWIQVHASQATVLTWRHCMHLVLVIINYSI